MKRKMIALTSFIILVIIVSGCSEQQTIDDQEAAIGMSDSFRVNSSGAQLDYLHGDVELNVPSGSLADEVDITITSISDPVEDSTVELLSCYEFSPNGQTFNLPITVIIHYDVSSLPAGMNESAIKIYVLNGSAWEPISGSFANIMLHYAVASVSHFSKMGAAGPAPSGGESTGDGDDEGDGDDNESSQYWFKASLYFYSHKDIRLLDWDDDDYYSAGVSAYWDPVPYVQHYDIKFEFGDNPPSQKYAWGCNWREQSKNYCQYKDIFPKKQGYVYHLGGDPNLEGYMGLFDRTGECTSKLYNETTGEMETYVYGRIYPEGKHGFNFLGVNDLVDDREELLGTEIGAMVGEMEGFVQTYVNHWEVWVRAVTERGS